MRTLCSLHSSQGRAHRCCTRELSFIGLPHTVGSTQQIFLCSVLLLQSAVTVFKDLINGCVFVSPRKEMKIVAWHCFPPCFCCCGGNGAENHGCSFMPNCHTTSSPREEKSIVFANFIQTFGFLFAEIAPILSFF